MVGSDRKVSLEGAGDGGAGIGSGCTTTGGAGGARTGSGWTVASESRSVPSSLGVSTENEPGKVIDCDEYEFVNVETYE
jgi:hypothetical protein